MQEESREQLAERLRAAEEGLRARDDFLATAAHELRSPLNGIALRLAALEQLAERRGEQELRAELARTRRSVDRYLRRAVVLLDVNRLNASHPPDRQRVSVPLLVRTVVEAHVDEARFHGTTIEWKVDAAAMDGCWDPHMAEEILANLVSNAIKYGHGSPVRVTASTEPPGVARFEVTDGGPGISEPDRARLFEKFSRVVATSRDRAGFGLGLWIVGRMVAAHAGSVEVHRPPRGGSSFVVKLPLEPGLPEAQEPTP